jgi:hypothetical protein
MADTDLRTRQVVRLASRPRGRRLLVVTVWAVLAAALFLCYLGLSRTYPENSDEANLVLMARDMLHGNTLLHSWYLSDVSFITYDLPQLAVVEGVFGWTFTAAHVSVALTFTLVVLIGALLARGPRAESDTRTGMIRMLLAGGIMFAPQTGVAVFVLLLSIGHIGTAVPVMLAWLLADRMGDRWFVPVGVALLLGWAAAGDSLVLVIGIWPLLLVAIVRMLSWLVRGGRPRELGVQRRLELSLLVAGGAAWLLSRLITLVIRSAGGFYLNPLPFQFKDVNHVWLQHTRITAYGLRMLFGVDVTGQHAIGVALALLHVVGLVLAVVGLGFALWRFFSWPADLISQLLLVGIIANLVAYVPSTLVTSAINVREVAPVLPFASVLAGRRLGPLLARYAFRIRAVALVSGVVLAGYAWTLIAGAAQPNAPVPYADLAADLVAAHLSYGLGTYWQSSVVTVETQGKVTIRALTDCNNMPYPSDTRGNLFQVARTCNVGAPANHGLRACEITPYPWETKSSWYDPGVNRATFIVQDEDPARYPYDPRGAANLGGALKVFGRTKDFRPLYFGRAGNIGFPPWHVSYYTRIYGYNLLKRLPAIRTGKCN